MADDFEQIHRALAEQIDVGINEDTTVYPFPIESPVKPCITVYPGAGKYVDYFTSHGPNGTADLYLRLKVEVDGDGESIGMKICAYLSIGTGNGSSVPDAVHGTRADGTSGRKLGGLVDDCVVLSADWADPDSDPGVAWLPVAVYLTKQNAEVG